MTAIKFTILGEPASRVTYIYGLFDPLSGECRYVGKSDRPYTRFKRHLNDDDDTHKARWIRSLKAGSQQPHLTILALVLFDEWQEHERRWIAQFRNAGANLTNSTAGGRGPLMPLPETRIKMRAAKIGRSLAPEHKAKVSRALKGKAKPPRTAEHAASLSASCKGRQIPPQHRAKLAAANKMWSARNDSGFKGVYFNKSRNKYEAHIKIDGKKRHLGRYLTIAEAANAYNAAAITLGWPTEGLNQL